MNQCRPCGCKGIRTCLICEKEYDIKPPTFSSRVENQQIYDYCCRCNKAWLNWDASLKKDCTTHEGNSLYVDGIFVLPDFLTDEEKETLLEGINKQNWDLSQSGRRKQNYGPKCNFKKRKLQIGNFNGFPNYSKLVHNKFKTLKILNNFNVIEQCSLEYDPKKGSSIDPHIDDCWVWGNRIVTVNVLGDTFLCLTKYKGDKSKYNLDFVNWYDFNINEDKKAFGISKSDNINCSVENDNWDAIIRIYQPEKSLIVLYNEARYEWEHFILREDIKNLRICLAYREFTPLYLPGGIFENIGANILSLSNKYW